MRRTRRLVVKSPAASRAFSLIELLVVVSIIVLLIGILVPALNAVRIAARKTQSQAISTELLNAMSQFRKDTRRLPGHFSVAQMASSDNWGGGAMGGPGERGFTETENVLLELLDAAIPVADAPPFSNDPDERIYTQIGPGGDNGEVTVNLKLSTQASKGAYIRFDGEVLRQITGQTTQGVTEQTPEVVQDLPTNFLDVVDPFGMPLLVWKRNMAANRNLPNYSLTEINYQVAASDNSAFYWATNAGYLGSPKLGPRNVNLRQDMGNPSASLFGPGDLATANSLRVSLAAILGNPGFPAATGTLDEVLGGISAGSDFAQPEAFRGDVIVHSAGADRSYFKSREDPNSDGVVGYLRYEASGAEPGPQAGTSEVEDFDDILTSGG